MNTLRSIIVSDDYKDDQKVLSIVMSELEIFNLILFFDTGIAAIDYLKSDTDIPF